MKFKLSITFLIVSLLVSNTHADSIKCQKELLNAKPTLRNLVIHVQDKNTDLARKDLESFVKNFSNLGYECGVEDALMRAVLEVNSGSPAFCSGDLIAMADLAKHLSHVEQLSNSNMEKLEAFAYMIPQALQDCELTFQLVEVMKEFSQKLGPLDEPHKAETEDDESRDTESGEAEHAGEYINEYAAGLLNEEKFLSDDEWSQETVEHYHGENKEHGYLIFEEGHEEEEFEYTGREFSIYDDAYLYYESPKEEEDINQDADGDLLVEKQDQAALMGNHNVEQIDDPDDYYDDHDDFFFADNSVNSKLRILLGKNRAEKSNSEKKSKNATEVKPATTETEIEEEITEAVIPIDVEEEENTEEPAPVELEVAEEENTEESAPVELEVEEVENFEEFGMEHVEEEDNTEEAIIIHSTEKEESFLANKKQEEEEEHEQEEEEKTFEREFELENTEETFGKLENEEAEEEAAEEEVYVSEAKIYHGYEDEDTLSDILYDMANSDIITFIDAINQLERIVERPANFVTFQEKIKAQDDLKLALDDALKNLNNQPELQKL